MQKRAAARLTARVQSPSGIHPDRGLFADLRAMERATRPHREGLTSSLIRSPTFRAIYSRRNEVAQIGNSSGDANPEATGWVKVGASLIDDLGQMPRRMRPSLARAWSRISAAVVGAVSASSGRTFTRMPPKSRSNCKSR